MLKAGGAHTIVVIYTNTSDRGDGSKIRQLKECTDDRRDIKPSVGSSPLTLFGEKNRWLHCYLVCAITTGSCDTSSVGIIYGYTTRNCYHNGLLSTPNEQLLPPARV